MGGAGVNWLWVGRVGSGSGGCSSRFSGVSSPQDAPRGRRGPRCSPEGPGGVPSQPRAL